MLTTAEQVTATKAALPVATPRIRILDGFRLIAALMVMTFHYVAFPAAWSTSAQHRFPHLYIPASYGWLGVELFFLISGFVICMSSLGRTVAEFAISRVVRLFPAYWIAVIATTSVLALWPTVRGARSTVDVVVNLTMLQSPVGATPVDAVYWTLFAEMRFYLLFAIVVWAGVTYRRVLAFCGVWLVASVFATNVHDDYLKLVLMPDFAPFFIAGVAYFLMYRYGPNLALWGLIGVCGILGWRVVAATNAHELHNLGFASPQWPTVALMVTFFAMMAVVALRWVNPRWRWLTTAGALTYPLYLIHEYIGWTLIHHFQEVISPHLLAIATAALMLVTAWLIHRFVERPLARPMKRALMSALEAVRRDRPIDA